MSDPARDRAKVAFRPLCLAALLLVTGCASGTRREIGEVKVGLAHSQACFRMLGISPQYAPVFAHMRRGGPAEARDRAVDGQPPSEAEASLAAQVGALRRGCEEQQAAAMQRTAPQIAALLRAASAQQATVYDGLATRQTSWAEARQRFWYTEDAMRIQLDPMLAELNENNRQRLEAEGTQARILGAALSGVAAGTAAGLVASRGTTRTFVRVR